MTDIEFMRRAIALARKGAARTSPGAMAGAVIVRGGEIVGEGFYTWDGVDHAEISALRQAGDAARGATVYTSLEPCSHFGRTPPCAQSLIDAGVARVVSAVEDPFPLVQGRGLAMLRDAGIAVECGLLKSEAEDVNEAFLFHARNGRAFGILKIAMTLDGKIATRAGESRWITSEASRESVQELRHSVDAVITGSGTFLADRPSMTDRTGRSRRRELVRIVLDRRGRTGQPPGWLVFGGPLQELMLELERRQIQSFLLECGPDLAFNAIREGLIDKIIVFIAPKLLGGREIPAVGGAGIERLADAVSLRDWKVISEGADIVIGAYVESHRRR